MASIPHSAEQNILVRCLPPKPTTIDLIGGIYCHICNVTFSNKKQFDSHYVNHKTGNEDTVYTCVVCYKQITAYRSFQGHCYLNHVSKDKFKCQHCSKMFPKLSLLSSHVLTVHTFTCMTCDRKFPSKNELVVHEILHKIEKSKPPYPCLSCKKIIDNSDLCEMHIDEHSITLYPCPICEETLPSKRDAVKHLTEHFGGVHSESDFTDITEPSNDDSSIDIIGGILCCFCDDLFKTRTEFDLHFANEHSDRDLVYTCIICKKQYDKYVMFGNHCYFHIVKNKYECDDCGKMFPRLSMLVTHTEAYHSGEAVEKPFGCDICGHAFKTKNRLIDHRRQVHSAMSIDCSYCGKTFDSYRDMLIHLREHKNIQQNWCRHCNLHFTTLSSCEKHLDVHRIKNYSCPVCSREYKEKYLIVKHISIHFESVMHICKVCSKTYNSRSRLQQHKKTHSNERSYTCTYCTKGFLKPIDLKQHMNIHTGLKPHKCPSCPKSFAGYPNWSKHLQRVHKIDCHERKQMFVKCQQIHSAEAVAPTMPASEAVTADAVAEHPSVEQCVASVIDNIDPATIQKELQQLFADNNNVQNYDLILDNVLLPENTATLVTDTAAEPLESIVQNPCVPPEYGPEFVNRGVETATINGEFIDLDDHIMPHIDPLLTIKSQLFHPPDIAYDQYAPDGGGDGAGAGGWEPPILTRYHSEYLAHDDITDFTLLSSL